MIESLYIGATGLNAQKTQIDTISNNLTNVATPGFKKDRVAFQDLMYANTAHSVNSNSNLPKVGYGISVASTEKVFDLGEIKKTDRALDLAIRGKGFLEVLLPNGEKAYTKAGSLSINSDGMLTTTTGYELSSNIQIPADTTSIVIREDGEVYVQVPDQDEFINLGRLELADFVNQAALSPIGSNLYQETEKSGTAFFGIAGENGLGKLAQGFIEVSNVELVEEMTNLVVAQRAYEVNSKIIQAADQMLSIVNDLRR